MSYVLGTIFLLLSVWQFVMFKRSLTHFKQRGDKNTSPFIMLALWSGLLFAITFLGIAVSYFF
ncbi:hypothetical protein JZO77_07900 [Enterococcus hulanensis]|uniref:hypothetical protein n=1 Tax=Enterococcus hulanensis TaxID=2559929 RepID=UPI001A8C31EC|nr:hypothetical protein [Enterococcus hulanensis]MBO0456655.1 hypothetical protein [Enterococcus hulanensis]